LVDQGKLNLDKPINDYLGSASIKDMSDAGKPVTLRHLLSHYSGLKAKGETDAMNSDAVPLWEKRLPKSLEELAAGLEAQDAPGVRSRYSNYGYALAGLAVQQVSGQSYEQYIVNNVLKPVGVVESGPLNPSPEMVEELALPYKLNGNKAIPEKQQRLDVFPAGDAYLSVPALATVLSLHLNGGRHEGVALLSEASLQEMHQPQFGGDYGLGVGTRALDSERLLTHAGGVPGYSTNFILAIDSKVGVYVASNAGRVHLPMRYLAQLSIDLMLGKELGKGLVREIVGIGTGLAADETTGLLRITDILPNSPASQAGLTADLRIEKVNGVSVQGKSVQECLAIIAGAVGTKVTLEVCNSDRTEANTVELTRQKFLVPS
jgi:CubicO group peptidase (beta-lactamase class C family)